AAYVGREHIGGGVSGVDRDSLLVLVFGSFPIPFVVIHYRQRMVGFGRGIVKCESLGCSLSRLGDGLIKRPCTHKEKTGPCLGDSTVCSRILRVQLSRMLEMLDAL